MPENWPFPLTDEIRKQADVTGITLDIDHLTRLVHRHRDVLGRLLGKPSSDPEEGARSATATMLELGLDPSEVPVVVEMVKMYYERHPPQPGTRSIDLMLVTAFLMGVARGRSDET